MSQCNRCDNLRDGTWTVSYTLEMCKCINSSAFTPLNHTHSIYYSDTNPVTKTRGVYIYPRHSYTPAHVQVVERVSSLGNCVCRSEGLSKFFKQTKLTEMYILQEPNLTQHTDTPSWSPLPPPGPFSWNLSSSQWQWSIYTSLHTAGQEVIAKFMTLHDSLTQTCFLKQYTVTKACTRVQSKL